MSKLLGDKMSSKERIDVNEAIVVHIVTRDDDGLMFWVHSHGMEKFGLPELEMRNVPIVFAFAAGAMINFVADYMLNEKRIKLGEILSHGRELFYFMRFDPLKEAEDHYTCDRWGLVHPAVGVAKIERNVLCCDKCRGEVMAFLLAEDGYEAGGNDMNDHLDHLVQEGVIIRMPRASGSKEPMYVPSARGVAIYESKKGQVECHGNDSN